MRSWVVGMAAVALTAAVARAAPPPVHTEPAGSPAPKGGAQGERLKSEAASEATDPRAFQPLRWRSIGPFRGGRVLAVAGAPDDPLRFYFGAVNGGVWETRDAGRTWDPIFDSAPVGSIGALAVAPSAPSTIYVGTGEADMRSDIAQGVGMFRSTDGGAHWAAAGLTDTRQIGRILVDPRDPAVLLVAALGHPYGPNAERGVFRSVDGGRTWARTPLQGRGHRGHPTSPSSPATPTPSTPPSGRRAGRRGTCIPRPTAPAAGCTSPPTAGAPGRSSRAAACRLPRGGSAWPCRPRHRIASTR